MAKNNIRNCCVCGTEYEYCTSCGKKHPIWKTLFDEEPCMRTFYIVENFTSNVVDKDTARKLIEETKIDINKPIGYVGKAIKEIFAEDTKEEKIAIENVQDSHKRMEYSNNKHRNNR